MSERPLFDIGDDRLARAAWSRIAESEDQAARLLLTEVEPAPALQWLYQHDGGGPPPGMPPSPVWQQARDRWCPRLLNLDPRRDIDVLSARSGRLLVPGDQEWPAGVQDLEDPPWCLWVVGQRPLDQLGGGVALVGSRASTSYGERICADIGFALAERGITVVSGGAFGIDAAAHRAALAAEGPVLAVMAGGLDRYYPRANADLLAAVAAGGAVVAEVPPGAAPMRSRFLRRNRLIAALAAGTVVVEAAWRSGALSTAAHAAQLLRPVGAVPGPVTSMASGGCHRLIRDGVATCVTGTEEVLELISPLGAVAATEPHSQPGLLDDLSPDQARLLDALPARAAARTDSLVRASGLSPQQVSAGLGFLELAGKVRRDGPRWRRARGR